MLTAAAVLAFTGSNTRSEPIFAWSASICLGVCVFSMYIINIFTETIIYVFIFINEVLLSLEVRRFRMILVKISLEINRYLRF